MYASVENNTSPLFIGPSLGLFLCRRLQVLALWLLGLFAHAAVQAHGAPPPASYETWIQQVLQGGPATLEDYLRLQSAFKQLTPREQQHLAQLQATADTIYGNYALAEQRHALAFTQRQRIACPAHAHTRPAGQVILGMTQHADIALFNELHTVVYARAYFLSLLPALRRQGYNTLALEALYPHEENLTPTAYGLPKADAGLDQRGVAVDTGQGGVYTREPIYAELIRQAYRLRFRVVAYDAPDTPTRDIRETTQATVLAEVALHPGTRMLLLAGGSHIWKAQGWMAQHLLAAVPDKRVVSIDLARGYQGCETADGTRISAMGSTPVALAFTDGSVWTEQPERTDLTILMNMTPDRTLTATWLYELRSAIPIRMDTHVCRQTFPCLVQARRISDGPQEMPADRMLIQAADEDLLLYLGPGDYVITVTTISGAHHAHGFLMSVAR